ncbi:MAG: hypothetical protein AAB913_00570 [Patescibacteria group bacterium]
MENFFRDLFTGLLCLLGIGGMIIIVIFWRIIKNKNSSTVVATPTTTNTTTATLTTPIPALKKSGVGRVFGEILGFIVVIGVILSFIYGIYYLKVHYFPDTPTQTSTPPPAIDNSYISQEALILMDYGYVDQKSEYISPYVNYKFKVRTERHIYYIQFTATNGGWTKKILIQEDTDLTIPENATQGPLKITAGPKETEKFRVQLYKRLDVRNLLLR